jgi:arabinogalactan oligomer / maltooligosaccharide transport system permease protein
VMSTAAASPPKRVASDISPNPIWTFLTYAGLALFDALGIVFIFGFVSDDNFAMAAVFTIIVIGVNIITFIPALYPLRWMIPGLALVTLLVIYPILYTVSTSLTNYSDGHLLTKQQTVTLLRKQKYIPPDAANYEWEGYISETGTGYALWLTREVNGAVEAAFAPEGQPITPVENPPEEAPASYNGYRKLERAERAKLLTSNAVFGAGEDTAQIASRNNAARPLKPRFEFDMTADTLTNLETGDVYTADNNQGFFINTKNNEQLAPGFRVGVGLSNFSRLVNDPGLRGPLIQIFTWTVLFAFLSVFTTFTLGLFMALVLNDPGIVGRKVIRSLLIIPYAMPGVIGIMVWRGMLNQNLGIITNTIADAIGFRIPWFTDAMWAKVAIILVNLWLGYPYMMLVCSGALQAIPSDVYEAAAVDGANPSQRFWQITLPLLLVTVGPLLIASFVFNFNNYLIIELLTQGDPQMPNTPTPAGATDILISYTYGLAFGSNRGADYGYASAITIIIFLIVAAVTMLQYRYTRSWEEVGENV